MMKSFVATFALLLGFSGCAQGAAYIDSREPDVQETLLLYMSYNILKEKYGPTTERCEEEFPTVRFIQFPTIYQVDLYCDPANKYGTVYGCFYYDNGWSGYEGHPTIVYSTEEENYHLTVLHEATHWYVACALGNVDNNNHKNIVWDYIPLREDDICLGYGSCE